MAQMFFFQSDNLRQSQICEILFAKNPGTNSNDQKHHEPSWNYRFHVIRLTTWLYALRFLLGQLSHEDHEGVFGCVPPAIHCIAG